MAAKLLNCRLESHAIDATSPISENLTIDIASYGNPTARKAVIISSGLHGVEGFVGSAIQLALLCDYLPHIRQDIAIVLIHALNPFGFAWCRRSNEDNIDLNRNFAIDRAAYPPTPDTYRRLDSFLNPPQPPSRIEPFALKAAGAILRYGMPALRRTLPVGQSDFPQGLFYSGTAPSQTERIIVAHLRRWLGIGQRVVHLDFHAGLGKWSREYLYLTSNQPHRQEIWRQKLGTNRLFLAGAADPNYHPQGSLADWCVHTFREIEYDFFTCEFGTRSPVRVLKAMRAENRAHWWSDAESPSYRRAKQDLLSVFSPPSHRWRDRVLSRGLGLCERSIQTI
jgi:predicted deacylase